MKGTFDRAMIRASLMLAVVGLLLFTSTGCIATAVVLGGMAVGKPVRDSEASSVANELVGKTPAEADAALGQRIRTLTDTRGPRAMMTYPVKGDTQDSLRWVVEVEDNRIVAVAKVHRDPDGGKSAIEKAGLADQVIGKSEAEIEAHERFRKPTLVLRDRSTGELLQVYDVRDARDLAGAAYCVLGFDADGRCSEIRLVGLSESSGKGAIGR